MWFLWLRFAELATTTFQRSSFFTEQVLFNVHLVAIGYACAEAGRISVTLSKIETDFP